MEFKCSGVDVNFLQWQRNGEIVGSAFTGIPNEDTVQQTNPFTLSLDSITRRNDVVNMTSRLVGNLSNFVSGDRITCAITINTNSMVTLTFRLRGKYNSYH